MCKSRNKIPFMYSLYVFMYFMYIIKIVDSLENSCLSIDGATKLVKYEIKKNNKKVDFLEL